MLYLGARGQLLMAWVVPEAWRARWEREGGRIYDVAPSDVLPVDEPTPLDDAKRSLPLEVPAAAILPPESSSPAPVSRRKRGL